MEENKSVQTVLSISNTDIVTMLMVKQKKVLEERLPQLKADLHIINEPYEQQIEEILNKLIEENKLIGPLKEAITTLHKVYNPKVPFRVELMTDIKTLARNMVTNLFYHIRSAGATDNKIVISHLPNLEVIIGNTDSTEEEMEKYEDKFYFVNDESEYEIPFKKKDHVIVDISEEDILAMRDIQEKINNITLLLRNDTKLKEEIVAKMTEKAINNNVELQAIVGDILLLE